MKLVVKRRPLLNCQPNCRARPHRMLLFTSFSNKQGDAWVVSKMRVFIAPNRSLYTHGSMTVAFVLLSLGNAPSSTAWSQYGGSCPPPPNSLRPSTRQQTKSPPPRTGSILLRALCPKGAGVAHPPSSRRHHYPSVVLRLSRRPLANGASTN